MYKFSPIGLGGNVMPLNEMIFKRKSCRSFTGVSVDAATIETIKAFPIKPLYPEIKVRWDIVPRNQVKCICPWTTPQLIAIYSEEGEGYLENIGFLFQQMDLYLQTLGLGVCWLGMGRMNPKTTTAVEGMKFVIMLAFGHPKGDQLRQDMQGFKRKAMEKIMTKKGTAKKQTIKEMKNTKLINKIVETTNDAKEIVPRKAKAYITELQNRFNMLNPYETSILCVFVEKFDSSNNLRDIANHYDISVSAMIEHLGSIDNLVKCKLIRRFKFRGEEKYFLSHNVLECLRKDKIMESKSLENLSISDFITEIEDIIERAKGNGMDYDDIYNELNYLIDKNQNLYIAQKFKEYSFCYEDLMLYICMLMRYINQYDDNMQKFEFEEWFSKELPFELKNVEEYCVPEGITSIPQSR